MRARLLMFWSALTAAVAAGGYHWITINTRSRLEADRVSVLNDTAEKRRPADETLRQLTVAKTELQALLANRRKHVESAASPGLRSSAGNGTPEPRPKPAGLLANPELRRWQLQAFVSDQRLRFAALLNRAGFYTEKLQAFDRIQSSWMQVMLDDSQTEAVRQQARATRDAQLKELFGPHYELWVDANRNQPARAIVAQIVQQTFQSSGALTMAQAEELTRIVAQHRVPPSKDAGGGQSGYDWDQIISDAQSILADRQREDFIAAIAYRRASEKMTAMAAKKKR
jgi:hypothetical protein